MITPIITMTINQIAERKYDLLFSDEDIKEMARNVRAKAIDDFAEKLSLAFDETIEEYGFYPENLVRQVAEQLKAGGTV